MLKAGSTSWRRSFRAATGKHQNQPGKPQLTAMRSVFPAMAIDRATQLAVGLMRQVTQWPQYDSHLKPERVP